MLRNRAYGPYSLMDFYHSCFAGLRPAPQNKIEKFTHNAGPEVKDYTKLGPRAQFRGKITNNRPKIREMGPKLAIRWALGPKMRLKEFNL